MSQATGLRSAATASHPSRIASRGIAPPPAKGSRTRGTRPPNAFRISSRRFSISAAPSSLLSRPQWRIPPRVSSFIRSPLVLGTSTIFPAIRPSNSRRSSAVPGSGSNVASKAALLAANGRRAGQMCSVETCPCRTFFSCTESRDTCRSGNTASINRTLLMFRTFLAAQAREMPTTSLADFDRMFRIPKRRESSTRGSGVRRCSADPVLRFVRISFARTLSASSVSLPCCNLDAGARSTRVRR